MRTKIISFIGEVKRKNLTQIELVNELGLHLDYFVTTGYESGLKLIGEKNYIHRLEKGSFNRFRQIYSFYKKNKNSINHVEIFGGGRFGFVYILLAKWFGLKVLLVERGGMNQYIKKENRYTITRFSSFVQYKLADICWYKEYYMKSHLERLGVKRLNFIPNGLGHTNIEFKPRIETRDIDFLWVNRVIPERHIDWIIELAQKKEFQSSTFELYGFLDDPYAETKKEEIESLELPNIKVNSYSDNVVEVYKRAKYFLLPADYVFGNNSLLEAMASGVVPIITDVHGSGHLIENQINGLISKNCFGDYEKIMKITLGMSDENWSQISNTAMLTVTRNYSLKNFKENLRLLYQKINDL